MLKMFCLTYMHVLIVSTCRNRVLIYAHAETEYLYACVTKKMYEYGLGNHGDAPVFVFRNDANGLTNTRSPR